MWCEIHAFSAVSCWTSSPTEALTFRNSCSWWVCPSGAVLHCTWWERGREYDCGALQICFCPHLTPAGTSALCRERTGPNPCVFWLDGLCRAEECWCAGLDAALRLHKSPCVKHALCQVLRVITGWCLQEKGTDLVIIWWFLLPTADALRGTKVRLSLIHFWLCSLNGARSYIISDCSVRWLFCITYRRWRKPRSPFFFLRYDAYGNQQQRSRHCCWSSSPTTGHPVQLPPGGVPVGDQDLWLCPFPWLRATSGLSCGNSGGASCFLSLSRQEGKEFCLMWKAETSVKVSAEFLRNESVRIAVTERWFWFSSIIVDCFQLWIHW